MESYLNKELKLTKNKERKIRKFLRQLTGAPNYCKIFHSNIDNNLIFSSKKTFLVEDDNKFPEFIGEPYHWQWPDEKIPPRWFTSNNGRKIHTIVNQPCYIPSTQRIEIGINVLNYMKIHFQTKIKSNYKLKIDNKQIDLPTLELGRWIIKHCPDKNKIKLIKCNIT